MSDKTIYTQDHFRLRLAASNKKSNLNWIVIPGGPGMGSEYLESFIKKLNLKGNTWLCDYSDDGSNRMPDKNINYEKDWPIGLINVLQNFDNVILITHSFGGFLTLATPEVEQYLKGLVILSSAPNNSWLHEMPSRAMQNSLPDLSPDTFIYQTHRTDESMKRFFKACIPYLFHNTHYSEGDKLLDNLPYCHKTYDWRLEYMASNSMDAVWYPKKIPTVIATGQHDHLIPIKYFKEDMNFHRSNISMHEIKDAGHFPWVENFEDTKNAITKIL